MSTRRTKFLLFRVYQHRDTKAYGQLYDLYFDKLYRYVYFKVPRSEDAEEITSEIFLRGWEYCTASRVDHASSLFYKIAKNLIADFYRQRKVTEPLEIAGQVSVEATQVQEVMIKQEHHEMMQLLWQLKEEYRDVLVMCYVNELSTKEISDILGKTQNNVRVLVHRAKKALREIAEPHTK